jgi:hypothetical protein
VTQEALLTDLYSAPWGLTLLIRTTPQQLEWFRDLFVEVAQSNHRLSLLSALHLSRIHSFDLSSDPSHRSMTKSLTMAESNGVVNLRWAKAPEEWHTTGMLVQGMIDAQRPSHQYLTEEGLDDVVIELSTEVA